MVYYRETRCDTVCTTTTGNLFTFQNNQLMYTPSYSLLLLCNDNNGKMVVNPSLGTILFYNDRLCNYWLFKESVLDQNLILKLI